MMPCAGIGVRCACGWESRRFGVAREAREAWEQHRLIRYLPRPGERAPGQASRPNLTGDLTGHPVRDDAPEPGQWACSHCAHVDGSQAGLIRHLDAHVTAWKGDASEMDALRARQARAARLTRVRITCGDWARVTRPSVTRAGTGGDGTRAVLLDPPYTTSGGLYTHGDTGGDLSTAARDWALTAPEARGLRIAITGYDHEHDELLTHGWTVHQGKSGRGAGYSTRADNGRRERIWASPACVTPHTQQALL